jgi:AcrR family transcriptional regulator
MRTTIGAATIDGAVIEILRISYARMTGSSAGQRRAASDHGAARIRLLEATCRLIASDGIGAATSRRITDAAGENLAAITYYFGSKHTLVAEALVAEVERLVDPAMQALEGAGDPVPRLMGAIAELLRTFADERDRAPAYLAALVETARCADGDRGSPQWWANSSPTERRRTGSTPTRWRRSSSPPRTGSRCRCASTPTARAPRHKQHSWRACSSPPTPTGSTDPWRAQRATWPATSAAPADGSASARLAGQ